jgi:hypothetical protein
MARDPATPRQIRPRSRRVKRPNRGAPHRRSLPPRCARACEREIPHGELAVAANGKGPCFGCRR